LALCRSISAIDFSSSSVAPIVRATLRAVSAEAAAAILVLLRAGPHRLRLGEQRIRGAFEVAQKRADLLLEAADRRVDILVARRIRLGESVLIERLGDREVENDCPRLQRTSFRDAPGMSGSASTAPPRPPR
jgi:hypothetical protein